MNLKDRIKALVELSKVLNKDNEELTANVLQSKLYNQWFTEENSWKSIEAIKTQFLDESILKSEKSSFDDLVITLHQTYSEKLTTLAKRLEKALVGKSNFAFKYMDYVDSSDSIMNNIQKEYTYYAHEIKKLKVFHISLNSQLNALDLTQKIDLLSQNENPYLVSKEIEELKSFFYIKLKEKSKTQEIITLEEMPTTEQDKSSEKKNKRNADGVGERATWAN